jgi:hypothetical protein
VTNVPNADCYCRGATYPVDGQLGLGAIDFTYCIMTVLVGPRQVECALGTILILDHCKSVIAVAAISQFGMMHVHTRSVNGGDLFLWVCKVGRIGNIEQPSRHVNVVYTAVEEDRSRGFRVGDEETARIVHVIRGRFDVVCST